MTLNNSIKRAIVRAYNQHMTLPAIAELFKIKYQAIVNIVYLNKVQGLRYD